jgi:cytochrome c-type biogenesis protein CcmH/NrfF
MPEDFWGNAIFSVIPTIVVGLIFWFTMRAIVRSDRSERETFSEVEAQERARLTAPKADSHN